MSTFIMGVVVGRLRRRGVGTVHREQPTLDRDEQRVQGTCRTDQPTTETTKKSALKSRIRVLEAEVARWTNLVSGIEYGGYAVEIGGVKLMGCDKTGRTEPENRLAELEAMRAKVLDMHKRSLAWDSDHHGKSEQIAVCGECSSYVSTVDYPCPTARVLGVTE